MQRLEQEYQSSPIITAPSVSYQIKLKSAKAIIQKHGGSQMMTISNPKLLPDPQHIEEYYEPQVVGTIISPSEFIGPIISLCVEKRGVQISSKNLDDDRILMTYSLPLAEVVIDFHDRIKSGKSFLTLLIYFHIFVKTKSLQSLRVLLLSILKRATTCLQTWSSLKFF